MLPLLGSAQFTQQPVACSYGNHVDRACTAGTFIKFLGKWEVSGAEVAGTPYDVNHDQVVNTTDLMAWISGFGREIPFDLNQVFITDVFSGSLLGVYQGSLQLGDEWVKDMNGNVLPSIPIRVIYSLGDEECLDPFTCFNEWNTFRIESMLGSQLLNFRVEFVKP